MNVIALISGGKDSCYNVLKCQELGHRVVCLANLKPAHGGPDELDSFMYQTVGHEAIEAIADAFALPLFRKDIKGLAVEQGLDYSKTENDETEDLYELIKDIQGRFPHANAVSVGAVASNYQRLRVENVCGRLLLVSLAFLWKIEEKRLFDEMIAAKHTAILVKVAGMGLLPGKHLGLTLGELRPLLWDLNAKYGSSVMGEGGEYETLTVSSPCFSSRRLEIVKKEIMVHTDDMFAPVGYLRVEARAVEDKSINGLHNTRDTGSTIAPYIGSGGASRNDFICEEDDSVLPQVSVCESPIGAILSISSTIDDAELAALQVLGALERRLAQMSLSLSAVIKVCLYVRAMSDFGAINNVYGRFFSANPPARMCVQAECPAARLSLGCLALHPSTCSVSTLHVQSISFWAPACIGPYSQAKQILNRLFVSGQLGLTPETMSVYKANEVLPQGTLAARHLSAVAKEFPPRSSVPAPVVVYVEQKQISQVTQAGIEDILSAGNFVQSSPVLIVGVSSLPKSVAVEIEATLPLCDVGDQESLEKRLSFVELIIGPTNYDQTLESKFEKPIDQLVHGRLFVTCGSDNQGKTFCQAHYSCAICWQTVNASSLHLLSHGVLHRDLPWCAVLGSLRPE